MKKSSTSSSRIEKGHIDSALSTACEEKDARVAATFEGLVGDGVANWREGEPSSSRRRLMLSACRFGGPRRREGRSNVHGISRAAQARQGGPSSSHWRIAVSSLLMAGLKRGVRRVLSPCGYCKNRRLFVVDSPSAPLAGRR